MVLDVLEVRGGHAICWPLLALGVLTGIASAPASVPPSSAVLSFGVCGCKVCNAFSWHCERARDILVAVW